MKTSYATVYTTIAIILSLVPLHAQTNLLKNGGGESDMNRDGKADAWFTHPGILEKSVNPHVILYPAGRDGEGLNCIRLSKSGGDILILSQKIDSELIPQLNDQADRRFVFKSHIRVTNLDAEGARLAVQIFTVDPATGNAKFASRITSPVLTGSRDWETVEMTFRPGESIPRGTSISFIEVNLELLSNEGTADFDDISLHIEEE